jgi:hypothetical protein
MRRMTAVPFLLILAIMCAYWAYAAISTLLRDLSANVTAIDLMVLFFLGFIAGIAVGLIPAARDRGVQSRGPEGGEGS